jgi:hypothetical protein
MNNPTPTLEFTIETLIKKAFYKNKFSLIGKIQKVDYSKNIVNIEILHNQLDEKDYPLVICPIQVFYSQRGGLLIPITEGSCCLILCNDEDYTNWYKAGVKNTNYKDGRRIGFAHHINNAIALPFLFSPSSLDIKSYDGSSVKLFKDNSEIEIKEKISIKNESASLKEILSELITTIKSATAVDPQTGNNPLDPATQAKLTQIDAKLSLLLN